MSSLNTNWNFIRQQHTAGMDVHRASLQYSAYIGSDVYYEILIYPGVMRSHRIKNKYQNIYI